MSWPVAFRVDADSAMGGGHLMRCLALAHACRANGGEPVFFTAAADGLLGRIQEDGFELVRIKFDAPDLGVRAIGRWASANKRSWVVLDGYQFNGAYQLSAGQAGARLMVIDDYVRLPLYHAKLLLDQNLGAEGRKYSVTPDCTSLLGPSYALLAPAFSNVMNEARVHPDRARRLLVTLGAADPDNVTSLVISALSLAETEDIETTVVIGGANQRLDTVREAAESAGLNVVVDATNMAKLMEASDLAITAAGSTFWEICRTGLPTISITLADNQRGSAAALAEAGVIMNLGWHEEVTEGAVRSAVRSLIDGREDRQHMGDSGQKLVDGKGAQRVAEAMLQPAERA